MTAVEAIARTWHEIGCANRPFNKDGVKNRQGTRFEVCKFRGAHIRTGGSDQEAP